MKPTSDMKSASQRSYWAGCGPSAKIRLKKTVTRIYFGGPVSLAINILSFKLAARLPHYIYIVEHA